MNQNRLPHDLTTLDLLKAAAIVLMIIDHIGFYWVVGNIVAPEGDPALWFRAIGRWCVPIWFFLIGYAQSRVITPTLVLGALVVLLANLVTGLFLIPLNVLFSMIIIRLLLTPVAAWAFQDRRTLITTMVVLTLFLYPSYNVTEYGTLGMLIALMGFAARRGTPPTWFYMAGIAITILSQMMLFPFSPAQNAVMSMGMMAAFGALLLMRPTTYPALTARWPRLAVLIVQGMGRHTLLIYVVHMVLFRIVALGMGWGYPVYGWFDWDFDIMTMFQNMPRPMG